MTNRSRGFQHERDLARRLWEHGFAVVRAPASGSRARVLRYPDIVAIYRGRVIALEVKTLREEKPVYVRREQVEKLAEFSRRAGAMPFIAVKYVGEGEWFLVPLDRLVEAGEGNYKIPVEAVREGLRLKALVSQVKGDKSILDYT
ncbi:Holliday junction resolvase Hjc [Desulfurococcus mucosus]|uniref:Crossover junction endodeoxyribonuclease Hjc n=1 Tax=Desulfurococcus mucosus (strain ATCC 35584 / DSM 2162 / JCM 9187 / O7/1) TaxID=765177 RepID=E8R8I6_DESM0|nr:Holliday junction resolvase Hjc [Desulfurococcus mucosus]ADV64812.1 Resolvase, Holliday junction-type [Desulfurococcus mucosus DSM 2162]